MTESIIIIKHNSKYAGMTEDEIAKIRYIRRKEWYKNLTEEKREKYKNNNPEKSKGVCEICEKEYGNIYQHRNTKKHKEKLEQKTEKNE